MKMKPVVMGMITLLLVFSYYPCRVMAMMDLNADPTPVVTSGSFICKTWGGTTMDNFNLIGGEYTAASFSFIQGMVVYNLSGFFDQGETLSLDITGSQWDMSGSMVGLDHNLISMSIQYQDGSGNQVIQGETYNSGKSKSPTLTGNISDAVPEEVVQVIIKGTFTCSWSSAFASASETVGVYATLGVKDKSIPVPNVDMIPKAPKNSTNVEVEESKSKTWWWPFGSSASKPKESSTWWPFDDHYPKVKPRITKSNDNAIVRFGDLHGEVNVRPNDDPDDDSYIFAEIDTPLRHGDRIRTLPNSGAILSFSDMSTFVIPPDTVIVLDLSIEKETKIGLLVGNIWINLKKMAKDGSMEVEMAQGISGMKGTIMAATVNENGDEVYLFTSSAKISSKVTGETMELKPGQKAFIDTGGEIEVSEFDIESKAKECGIQISDLVADGYIDKGINRVSVILTILSAVLISGFLILVMRIRKKRRTPVPIRNNMHEISNYTGQHIEKISSSQRYCGNCGKRIYQEEVYCANCGSKIE